MKICRRCAHTRRRGEFPQTDVRTPHSDARRAQNAKLQFSNAKHSVRRSRANRLEFGLWTFGICTLGVSPPPRLRRLPDWLCSRPEAEWGFVMRYRSATVAELHGLPCYCRIKWKEPQEHAEKTAPPAPSASPNPVHPLTMTWRGWRGRARHNPTCRVGACADLVHEVAASSDPTTNNSFPIAPPHHPR